MKENFGSRSVNEALNNIGKGSYLLREQGLLKTAATGIIGSIGTVVKSHTFDGIKDS